MAVLLDEEVLGQQDDQPIHSGNGKYDTRKLHQSILLILRFRLLPVLNVAALYAG